jgi:hypothetical protein
MEPYKLRRWRSTSLSHVGQFFTCARPGRSKGARDHVPDDLVHQWVRGLPGDTHTVILSLLGRKHGQDGGSEFSFYSFCGPLDLSEERRRRPSFQEWLDRWHRKRCIQVLEHPTYDFRPVPTETLDTVASVIRSLLSEGRTVVVMDSGGETRTRQVCQHMGFVEDTRMA